MKLLRNAAYSSNTKNAFKELNIPEWAEKYWLPLIQANQSTIEISEDSPEWEPAYSNWINGKMPTNDPKWKQGVFLSIGK